MCYRRVYILFVSVAVLLCACNVAVAASMEIVPGASVGKVKLGMSRAEVQDVLGDPNVAEGEVLVYESEKTGNLLIVGCPQTVETILFTSPDFTVADGLSTRNALNLANKAGYRKWAKKGEEYVGWTHPSGGLAFVSNGPSDDTRIFGLVYNKNLSLAVASADSEIYEVENEPVGDGAAAPGSGIDWEGDYRYTETLPGSPPWQYSLAIRCLEGSNCAELKIDGPQTEIHVLCSVEMENSNLKVKFLKDRFENQFKSKYKQEDVLLVLARNDDGSITTNWEALRPILSSTMDSGLFFVRGNDLRGSLPGGSATNIEQLDYPSQEPAEGMLVFKGLFIGMHLLQAATVLDQAIEFTHEVLEVEGPGAREREYRIKAIVGGNAILVTSMTHLLDSNTIYSRPILIPLDPQLDERIESHFDSLGNMQESVQRVVNELNLGLRNGIVKLDNGFTCIAIRKLFVITATGDGLVNCIILMPELTNCWFNVTDMAGGDFVQQFKDSYKIPSLEPDFNVAAPEDLVGAFLESIGLAESQSVTTWVYTSPVGYKLSLTDEKRVTVEAVARASQRSFD
jgi:hypothetical protein